MTRALIVAEGVHELGGALVALAMRLAECSFDVTYKTVRDNEVRIHMSPGQFQGFERRLVGWMSYAEEHRFEVMIAVIDEDGEHERRGEVDAAQSHELFEIRRAIGIAIRSFDAWMLADEKALTSVLGATVSKQKSPESMRNPKKRFGELQAQSARQEGRRDLYAQIAAAADIELIAGVCPKGFARFAERVRALAAIQP
jgi:hypothetical protein